MGLRGFKGFRMVFIWCILVKSDTWQRHVGITALPFSSSSTAEDVPCGGHTVVIGAGASGLAAAHFLSTQNCSVLLVEARARVGGRSYSTDPEDRQGIFDGVDRGAHWIHGGQNNPITTAYLDHFGIRRLSVGGDSTYEGERNKMCLFCEATGQWVSPAYIDIRHKCSWTLATYTNSLLPLLLRTGEQAAKSGDPKEIRPRVVNVGSRLESKGEQDSL